MQSKLLRQSLDRLKAKNTPSLFAGASQLGQLRADRGTGDGAKQSDSKPAALGRKTSIPYVESLMAEKQAQKERTSAAPLPEEVLLP